VIEGWDLVTLGDVLDVLTNGVNCKQNKSGCGQKISRIESIASASFDINRVGYAELTEQKKTKYRLQQGDILFSHINSAIHVGKTAVFDLDEEVYHGVNLLKMRPKSNLVSAYLELYLKYIFEQGYWRNICKQSVNQASVNQQDIKLVPISFPRDQLEQKRIVSILDEAFAGISQAVANAEKNLANARELFESYLNNVFTQKGENWLEKKLVEVCSIKHGFAFKSQFFSTDGDYVVLTPGSFYENGGFRNQGEKTKYYVGEIPDGYILNEGDFLFAMTEQAVGLLGSSLIVPQSNYFLHNQRLGLVQVVDEMTWDNDFFHHQFNTKYFRNAVQSTASGLKVRHTSPTKLGDISIFYPPKMSDQKKIASVLNKMMTQTQCLETIYQQKLTALSELKQSILQKAFTGELAA